MDNEIKQVLDEVREIVDVESGEVLETIIKKHTIITNKDKFFLAYTKLFSAYEQMSIAEVKVFSYLIQHFNIDQPIVMNAFLKKEIEKSNGMKESTIRAAVNGLISNKFEHPLLYKVSFNTYKLNPRYAFYGSHHDRNSNLKAVIELECRNC